MTELTFDMKELICERAMRTAKATKKSNELFAMMRQLAVDVYDSIVKENNSPFLLNGFNRKEKNLWQRIACRFGDSLHALEFTCDGITRYDIKEELLQFDQDHEFSVRFYEIREKLEDCFEEELNLEMVVREILKQCKTVEQLEKSWPQLVNFLDDTYVAKNDLNDVLAEDLNKNLDITKE